MSPSGMMPGMVLHGLNLERGSRVSLRRQLVGHLESRILGGQIAPGRRLPSLRRAEEFLGLHRNTIAAAYRELVRHGLANARPGSGVYVRVGREADLRRPRVVVRKPDEVDLVCPDLQLAVVLQAELQVRLSLCVRVACDDDELGVPLRLTAHPGLARRVRSLPRPSIVAVVSRSELVHRLASIAVLIHGAERIGYLPVSPANRGALRRAGCLTAHVVADYAELSGARRRLGSGVLPMPVISAISMTALTSKLYGSGSPASARADRPTCRNDPCEKVSKQP